MFPTIVTGIACIGQYSSRGCGKGREFWPISFGAVRVGRRPQMMIEFQRCSGQVEVFAYSRLTQIRSENPNLGFSLIFGDKEVTIEGQQLATLFHYICEHRAAEVIEADRASLMAAEDECAVSSIICR